MNTAEKSREYIWHPFTQMQTADLPVAIIRGRGTILYGEDGKEYIDAVSSWWVNLHGHSHGRLAPMPRQFDVGVDAWDMRPVTLAEIQASRPEHLAIFERLALLSGTGARLCGHLRRERRRRCGARARPGTRCSEVDHAAQEG